MIISTLNLSIIIEYVYITNYTIYFFWKPPSLWGSYLPGVGMIGMFFGSFIIIFGSIYEMKRNNSLYYLVALLIASIILITWTFYYYYSLTFFILSPFLLLFFIIIIISSKWRPH